MQAGGGRSRNKLGGQIKLTRMGACCIHWATAQASRVYHGPLKREKNAHYQRSKSEFLQVGLVRISLESGRNGQTSFRSGQAWSEIL